ncbi:acyl-CoA dehydrogenase family protein [Dactylosporangium sp. CS-033363]|uniref:acyl-CoA dehydrogenase family protein n=1 Tax=Dactylosporangium sp. CS-033363 TaxID=3239935 RepID=UPI003D90F63C
MHFAPSDTQLAIRQEARRFLTHRYPPGRVGELADADGPRHDPAVWPQLRQLGWLDRDAGLPELALVAEECGRALLPAPWWVSAGAARRAFVAAGYQSDAPAVLARDGDCTAAEDGDGWRIEGVLRAVPDAAGVAEVVVTGSTRDGSGLFRVAADDVAWTAVEGPDPLRAEADGVLRGTAARLLVAPGDAGRVGRTAALEAEVLRACEAVGVADRALEFGLDHARTREQFGKVIGGFQAVAHPLADGYAAVEFARSLAYRAACVPDDEAAVAAAAHAATSAALLTCETAIQVCGGMGVTWEFPLHRWYRRALWHAAYQASGPDVLDIVATAALARGSA